MRTDDFFVDVEGFGHRPPTRHVDVDLLDELRRRPLEDTDDIEVAVPLARLVHDDLEVFGTSGGPELGDRQMRLAIQALHAVVGRLGIDDFEVPFRDFSSFKNWWVRNGAYGSWQKRRDLLSDVFDPLHDRLSDLELRSVSSSLVEPISPHPRTGWAAVDAEISELRRHFQNARTPQDYRAVGLDCVAVTEALSAHVYDAARHLRADEEEPPVANTKARIERFVEDAAPGPKDAALRKLARAAIEFAQHVKHSKTPTRSEAGIAADAVIQLANLLRRLDEPDP